jgi:hypothetical protein
MCAPCVGLQVRSAVSGGQGAGLKAAVREVENRAGQWAAQAEQQARCAQPCRAPAVPLIHKAGQRHNVATNIIDQYVAIIDRCRNKQQRAPHAAAGRPKSQISTKAFFWQYHNVPRGVGVPRPQSVAWAYPCCCSC